MSGIRGAFAHVAVCVDRSEAARRGLAEARRLRPEWLSVVHVAGEPVTIAESPLPRLLQDLPEGEPVLLTGRAAERIIAWARDARPDVVVAASHAGRIEGVLGSTTRRLATSAPCPALILPPGVAASADADGGPAPYAHIACCIDRAPASLRALAEARRLRALGPGRLSLVHVSPRALIEAPAPGAPAGAPRDRADDERAWLHATAAGVAGAEPVALTGLAAGAAVDWARQAHPDLIVAAAHRGPVERALLGSFAAHVAREAPCPVLLTR